MKKAAGQNPPLYINVNYNYKLQIQFIFSGSGEFLTKLSLEICEETYLNMFWINYFLDILINGCCIINRPGVAVAVL